MLEEKLAIQLKSEADSLEEKLAEYADAETDEDKALRLAYEAIARGDKVIDILSSLSRETRGSTRERVLPICAFAPATAPTLSMEVRFNHLEDRGRGVFARSVRTGRKCWFETGEWKFDLPLRAYAWDAIQERVEALSQTWTTTVPHVPLNVRKEFDITDPDRLVLFEVPAWTKTAEERRLAKPVNVDPVLLRHLTGTLYVVEAVWDFTDLEAQLLAGIRR